MTASFSASWLRGDAAATAFLPDGYRRTDARAEAARVASARRVSPALLDVLISQNSRLAPSPAREKHLQLLGREGTTVMVSGQQVGLFLGPLFTLYKAASAIVDARALEAETGRPCVPVFWLQTEDHDLAEIDHVFVPRSAGAPLRVSLEHPDSGTCRSPVAHVRLGDGVQQALQKVREIVETQPHAAEHLELLAGAYRPDSTLCAAFAQVLSSLFAEEGLVFFDPRDPRVAPLIAPVHRKALEDAAAISDVLTASGKALTAAGFSEQVHIRPGAPLSFYSPDGVEGPRYRLDPAGKGVWTLVGHPQGATVTTDVLLGALEREPLRFTTSALLRPLVQDTLLPTAGYIGGPGEIAYFAQLAPLYGLFKMTMPLIVPRARFRVLDDRTLSLLEKLGISADDAGRPPEEILARVNAGSGFETPEQVQERLLQSFNAELKALGEKMKQLDPGFGHAVERTEETVRTAVSRLVGKYGRAVGQRDQVATERLERVRGYLAPEGAPQERIHGMAYYACRFGTRGFTKQVLERAKPFSGELEELRP